MTQDVSLHEAGHAVLARFTGARVSFISKMGDCGLCCHEPLADLWGELLILAAGDIAQRVILPSFLDRVRAGPAATEPRDKPAVDRPSGDVLALAAQTAQKLSEDNLDDRTQFQRLVEDAVKAGTIKKTDWFQWWLKAGCRARRILQRNARPLADLADELRAYGFVSGGRIAELLRDVR